MVAIGLGFLQRKDHDLRMKGIFLTLILAQFLSGATRAEEVETILRKRPITSQDYFEVLGILAVRLFVPEDGSLAPCWRFSDGTEQVTASIDLEGVPTGEEVHLFLWAEEWAGANASEPGIRYVIQFSKSRRSYDRIEGTLPLPENFRDLSVSLADAHFPGGQVTDKAVLKFEKPGQSCELLFYDGDKGIKAGRSRPINSVDLYYGTGILGWRLPVYADLEASEYLAFEWPAIPDLKRDSGFSLQGIPRGQEVHAYVHIGEWQKGNVKEKIRVQTSYREENEKMVVREGAIQVPPKFTDLYSYLQAGDTLDGGWMLLVTNRFFKDGPSDQISLEAVYRFGE